MKNLKKFFLIEIILSVIVYSLSSNIFASSGKENYNLKSDFDCVMEFVVVPELGEARIDRIINKNIARGKLVLPDMVFYIGNELTIVEVGVGAFQECKDLTEVIIPSSIKTLAYNSFSGCVSLKKLVLKEGLENICMWAFEGCKNLKDINIPNSVVRIDSGAFLDSGLDSIKLPTETQEGFTKEWHYLDVNKPLKIDNNISKDDINDSSTKDIVSETYCSKIDNIKYSLKQDKAIVVGYDEKIGKEIEIPDTVKINNKEYDVTEISDYAFFGCLGLEKIKFNNNIKSVGAWAFRCCENLTEIEFGESLTEIKSQAFADCLNLESVVIPGTVEYIENATFAGCESLKQATIKEGVKYIGIIAFEDCVNLSEVEIPKSLMTIYKKAFFKCNNLKSLKVPDGKEFYVYSGVVFDNDTDILKILEKENVYVIDSYKTPVDLFCELDINSCP